jgi:hypothetical protein
VYFSLSAQLISNSNGFIIWQAHHTNFQAFTSIGQTYNK